MTDQVQRVRTAITEVPLVVEDESDEELNPGKYQLFADHTLNTNATCVQLTNQTVREFNSLYRYCTEAFARTVTRGPKPKIGDKDALFCLLVVYKSGCKLIDLAALLKVSEMIT